MSGMSSVPNVFATQVGNVPASQLDANWNALTTYINAREITRDTLANRPAAGTSGRWYFATDVNGGQLYIDTGTTWLAVSPSVSGPALALGIYNVTAYGATGDTRFMSDASVTSGAAVLDSLTGNFTAADVGRRLAVQSATTLTSPLYASVASVTSATQLVMSTTAGVSGSNLKLQIGTDDTAAIQAAINSATLLGGRVWFPAGVYSVSGLNASMSSSLYLEGAAWGVNTTPPHGAVLVWDNAGSSQHVIDGLAAVGLTLKHLQIGHTNSPARPQTGLLLAQTTTSSQGSLVKIEDCFFTGEYSVCALYVDGVGDSLILRSSFWNYFDSSVYTVVFCRDNVYGLASVFQTIATAEVGVGNWDMIQSEFHEHGRPAGGASPGLTLRLRGARALRWEDCLISGSAQTEQITVENSTGGTACGQITWEGVAFYTENGTNPVAHFNLINNVTLGMTFIECTFVLAASAAFTGSGIIEHDATVSAAQSAHMNATQAAGATNFFSTVQSGTSADVQVPQPVRAWAQQFRVICNPAPGVGETVVVTLRKNGSDTTVTATISGANTTASDTTHAVIFDVGDTWDVKAVSSGGAATLTVGASWSLLRF